MGQLIFKGKNAVVIAASKGIAFAIAKCLYKEGANIYLNSHNIDNLKSAENEIRLSHISKSQQIHLIPFDINDQEEINSGIQNILNLSNNRIDFLITNSVHIRSCSFSQRMEGDWDKAINYQFKAVSRIIERIIPSMIENKYGRIVNIGSISSKELEYKSSLSTSARLMVSGYLKSMSDSRAAHNIRVNQILCGFTKTETLDIYLQDRTDNESITKNSLVLDIVKKIPIGRFAEPEEIGKVAKFLCSDDSSYITGQSIVVDGGLVRQL